MSGRKRQQNKRSGSNTLRVIGGEWRSRKLPFVDAPGLRPTPDRIRETLFNWLQGDIHGSNCLDLFAGSGILGFEALSRGASSVSFVEKNKQVAMQLQSNIVLLDAQAILSQTDALDYLQNRVLDKAEPFDLIFLDPPYRQGLLEKVLEIICDKESGLLTKNTLIYLEHESEECFDWQEFDLTVLKQAKAGQVKSYLMSV